MTFSSDRGRIVPPSLDDRTWQDLVDEMRGLIPKYSPAWTDNNPSDIGITLIELFAWLAESVIFRLNQVPDKNYVAFLNLLGITRDTAIPAQAYLTFTSGAGPVLVSAGAQASVPPQGTESPIVFETDEDVRVLPIALPHAVLIGPYATGAAASQYADVTTALVGPPASRLLLTLPAGQNVQVCLGFDQPTTQEIQLPVRLYAAGPDPGQVTVSWVYSQAGAEPMRWPAVPATVDGTKSLQQDGTVQLTVPGNWAGQRPTAPADGPAGSGWATVTVAPGSGTVTDERFWLGLRITSTTGNQLAIGIDRILFNAAAARTALTLRSPEVLGDSTGQPFQTFPLQHRPLFRRPDLLAPYGDLVVQVGVQAGPDPADWQQWTLADELPVGPGTCYRLNPVAGEITTTSAPARGTAPSPRRASGSAR
jgi:predicted phage baseplate assembly protein